MTLDVLPSDLARWVGVLGPARQLAEVLAETDFVPKGMRGNPDAVTAAIMYGDELGLGPMQSLAGMDVVEGKPRPSAELARALILRDGHTLTVHDATGSRVRVSGLRAGRPESERVTVEWTIDMARAAGLVNKSNWRQYPRAMLMARATGDLARILFPDVIKGLGYLREAEDDAAVLDGWAGPEEPAPVAPPAPPAIQRRPRSRPGSAPEAGMPRPSPHGPPEAAMPDLAPETDPGSENTAGPPDSADMPDPMRRAMFAAIGNALGPKAQRVERLALCSAILGRQVESSTDLGRSEVSAILTWLDDRGRGLVGWEWDEESGTGRTTHRGKEPTPAEPIQDVPLPDPTDPADPWVSPTGPDPWVDPGGGHE
jgi:hypothetical protein